MKILTFLVITLFSCMTAHAAERKWRSLAGVMYLDENSVVVTNEPKLVNATIYVHNSKTNENLLSNTTVDCKDNTYYIDDLIQVYDEKFVLKRAILSPINTRQDPKKITSESLYLALVTLCNDSNNERFREKVSNLKSRYDRNSIGQLYNFMGTNEWFLFHGMVSGFDTINVKGCESNNKLENTTDCKSAKGLLQNYGSLNYIPDNYRYQNAINIKQLALSGKLDVLKSIKLYSTWSSSIYKKAESYSRSSQELSRVYALLLFYEDVTGKVVNGIKN